LIKVGFASQVIISRLGKPLTTDSNLLIADEKLKSGEVLTASTAKLETVSRPRVSNARMMVQANGRCGFELIQPPKHESRLPDKNTLVAMLKLESSIRTSAEASQRFDELDGDEVAIHAMLTDIQQHVCDVFGYGEVGPIALQSARARFADDVDIINAAFYLKYNRARQGKLKVGDSMPDVALLNLDGSSTSLLEYYCRQCKDTSRPLVLVAGSRT